MSNTCTCYHKEFMALGSFVVFVVYFYFSVIWSIIKDKKD